MSVVKSKRSESSVDFLQTARELEIYTIKKVSKFPKTYTFYISQPLAQSATEIYNLVKEGNSMYPQNKHEGQMRLDCFLNALAKLQGFVGQLEIATEIFSVDIKQYERWSELISKEDRLLRALIKKERVKFNNLP